MIVKEVTVTEFLVDATAALGPLQLRAHTLFRLRIEFRAFSKFYGGDTNLTRTMLTEYVQRARRQYEVQQISLRKFRLTRRAIGILEQYYQRGSITWRRLPSWEKAVPFCSQFETLLTTYRNELEAKGYSTSTIKGYRRIAYRLLLYIHGCGHTEIAQVTRADVRGFIPHIAESYPSSSMNVVLTALRAFFLYLTDQRLSTSELTSALPRRAATKTLVVSPMTLDEEQRLLAVIDRQTAIGKRDWAMILLAMRTGLRTVDIIRLQFENIDWRKNTLSLIQKKTQRPLVLPLLPEVGNALADYIINGRPLSDSRQVFLRSSPPYIGFANAYGCSGRVNLYMKEAGIRQTPGERCGTHWLRHNLATHLLEAETPVSIIASILGHGQKSSTQTYLSSDKERLRACALGLDGIEPHKGV